MKRIKKKVPSTRIAFHFRPEKTKFATCTNCGSILHGTHRATVVDAKKIPASGKNPNRPFAGQLCGTCVSQIFRERARVI